MDLPDFDEKEESLLEDIIDEDNSYSKAEEIDLNSDFILKQFEEDNNSLDNEIENANSIQNIDTKKATSIKKKNKNKVEDNDKHLERLRRRIVKEMKDYVRPVKGQVKIKADHKNELFDIAVPLNKFCVVLEKDEYKIYTDNSNSYIIADQPNLRIMYRKLYVYIEKYNGVYFVVTNQDIQFCEKVSGMSKAKDIVSFYAKSLKELELENDVLNITCKEIEDEELIQSNDTLLISEEENKVYLPYTADELKEDTRIFNDLSVSEIIQKKYVHSLKLYKNSMRARFREGFELMHNREEKSFKESVMLGIELMFEFNLHPAIISACRTLEELDIYLDCLDDNELEKFSCFKIIYKAMPVIAKNNNKVQVS